ncbi:nascent polypeptide-associated complex subunit alpha, muscle-specific form-like [Antechinus flavipes]|uniref:nascent polypeptide-associated complex subunit alpha, muscle-specific form-like n=1 Tax=Antechinus flavipes TaxID=38775 RepID=UPI0022366D1C|nr:nascent polypeptide-associated complex subunit alpha, muscle-specific form-like [Antechinus flavipes]
MSTALPSPLTPAPPPGFFRRLFVFSDDRVPPLFPPPRASPGLGLGGSGPRADPQPGPPPPPPPDPCSGAAASGLAGRPEAASPRVRESVLRQEGGGGADSEIRAPSRASSLSSTGEVRIRPECPDNATRPALNLGSAFNEPPPPLAPQSRAELTPIPQSSVPGSSLSLHAFPAWGPKIKQPLPLPADPSTSTSGLNPLSFMVLESGWVRAPAGDPATEVRDSGTATIPSSFLGLDESAGPGVRVHRVPRAAAPGTYGRAPAARILRSPVLPSVSVLAAAAPPSPGYSLARAPPRAQPLVMLPRQPCCQRAPPAPLPSSPLPASLLPSGRRLVERSADLTICSSKRGAPAPAAQPPQSHPVLPTEWNGLWASPSAPPGRGGGAEEVKKM